MSPLEAHLNDIQRQKELYLIPQNLRKDVSLLGVTGTLESGMMTQEEYQRCIGLADDILGSTASYAQLAYIESTASGTQFIELDYIPKTLHTKYEVDYTRLSYTGVYKPVLNNENDVRFGILSAELSSSYGIAFIGSSTNFASAKFPISNDVRYHFELDKTGLSVNGTKYLMNKTESGTDIPDVTGEWSTCVNHRKTGATTYSPEVSHGRWYEIKIYEDDVLIRRYVPAKEIASGKICLYEIINKKFYYNLGTTEFIGGPEL